MLLAKIQSSIIAYNNWLHKQRHHPRAFWWETVQHFQAEWNPEAADPAAMFDRCLQNSETRRLWQAESWEPKRVMLAFWRFDPGTVRLLFEDLFNETRELEARIGRFLFGCDSLLRDYKQAHPTSVENNHYHDDYRMIALYLACRYPESYAPYDFSTFKQALVQLGARDIPERHDVVRYFKMLRTIQNFLEKDPEVLPALQRLLDPRRHFQGKTLLVAADCCAFLSSMPTPSKT